MPPNNANHLLRFSSGKSVPLILQTEIAECGLATMAMIASYYGHQLDMPAMRKRFASHLKGMSLQQLISLGDSLCLASRALQCPIEDIHKLQVPCILHWDMNHFVVLTEVSGKGNNTKYTINDPAVGQRTFTTAKLSKHFTGICLELTPTRTFKIKQKRQK